MRYYLQQSMFILFLVSSYMNYKLLITSSFFIPYFFSFFSGFILLLLHFNKARIYTGFISIFMLISAATILFSPKLYPGILKEELLAFAQLFLSLICFSGFMTSLQNITINRIRTIITTFLIILLIGALLERTVPLVKFLSDSFRNAAYHSDVFRGDRRDFSMVGFVRPKFFSREPSFVSHYTVLLTVFWYLFSSYKKKLLVTFLIMSFGIIVIGSPKMIILLPLIIICDTLTIKNLIRKYNVIFLFLIVLGSGAFIWGSYYLFNARVERIISGADVSTYMRLILPAVVTLDMVRMYPLFGVGLGAKENTLAIFNEKVQDMGFNYILNRGDFTGSFHSFTVEAVLYYGIIGCILLIWLVNKYLLGNLGRIDKYRFWLMLILISMMGSSLIGIRTWVTVGLLIYTLNISAGRRQREIT